MTGCMKRMSTMNLEMEECLTKKMNIMMVNNQTRERAKHVLRAKLDRHVDKVDHIFKTHCDNIVHSDTDSDNDRAPKGVNKPDPQRATKTELDTNKQDDSKSDRNTDTDKPAESKDDNESETTRNHNQRRDSIVESPNNAHDSSAQVYQVRVSKLNKVIRDLGYLLGLVFTTYDNYMNGDYDEHKTDKSIASKIKAY
jgi:hypothetical protein